MAASQKGTGEEEFERCVYFLAKNIGFSPARINEQALKSAVSGHDRERLEEEQLDQIAVEAVTVGETYFFRHRFHFDWLKESWLPGWKERFAQGKVHRLRVLSAGCSTGEEAYTLAAVLQRQMGGLPFEVVGFDINEKFLRAAERGSYGPWSLRGVDREHESDWLHYKDGQIQIAPDLREKVRFLKHNIIEPLREVPGLGGPYDLIFCRNLLIYFHADAVQKTYQNLATALSLTGALVVGPSDPGPGRGVELRVCWEEGLRYFSRVQQGAHPSLESGLEEVTEPGIPSARAPRQEVREEICELTARLGEAANLEEGYELLRRRLEEHSMDIKAHVLGALYASDIGYLEEGLELGRRACFLAPEEPYVLYVLSEVCRRGGWTEAGVRYRRWAKDLLMNRDGAQVLQYSDGVTAGELLEVLDVSRA